MKCPRCQQENPPQAKFCLECAAPLALRCTNCGTQLPTGAKFCFECATPVGGPASAPRFVSPEAYTPKHLAERIINSKAALEGERKQVTILFADLKGSMELLADRDPEEARKLLDPVIEHMMEAVHRYEGTVNQVMGDGIMALFGAPLAHEDHAVRACYAALRMQESVKRYADGVFRRYGVPVEIRVGLNSGEVVVRAIGSDLHMDYTAVGQTTHLAARMEQMARPGTILLAPDTLTLAEGFVQVTSRGPVPVKGLGEPIEIFELAGASPVRSRLHAAASRGLTRFVGRDAEIELLRRALERAGESHGQVVAVVGEPGVGKSRLVWEFTHSHRSHGWLVLETASVSYGRATAYLPVIELLRSYFGTEPRDDNRKLREKVTGKLLSLDRALEPTLPVFLSLLDVPVGDAEWTTLDPSQRRRQTLDALKRLLLRETQVQPVLLVVEDLHWIDSETQAWLDLLVESFPTARLLLLVNYRPEYRHAWGSKTYYQQVRLDALSAASAEELMTALLGTGPGLEDLRRLLIDRTQGNPFFVEESVRALVEIGTLAGERGAYRLAAPVPGLQLPATAHAILAARIDRLAPEDKRLLQAAAVVGKDVPFPLLQAIAEEPEEPLREGLARLQAAEFLYEARLFPELEFTFKHALTLEAAYSGLLEAQRVTWHAAVVTATETIYAGDRLAERLESLAEHAFRGCQWQKALEYQQRAGLKAYGRAALRAAIRFFERALVAAERLPGDVKVLETSIDLRLAIRNALVQLSDIAAVEPHLREAERLAHLLGDRRRITQVASSLTNYLALTGEMQQASAKGREALENARALGDRGLLVVVNFYLGQLNYGLGDYRAGRQHLEAILELLRPEESGEFFGLSVPPATMSRSFLALCLAELGAFRDATRVGQEALQLAEAGNRDVDRTYALRGLVQALAYQGQFGEALPMLAQGLALSRVAAPVLVNGFQPFLAYAYIVDNRAAEAEALLQEALALFDATTAPQLVSALWAGEGLLLLGCVDDARDLAERGLEAARRRGARGPEAWALRLVGAAECHGDEVDVEKADSSFRDALRLAEDLGMRPLVAHCHLGLGKLYRRTDKREQARERLATATTMYREMGMTYWLEKAEAWVTEQEGH
jgi:class 3 adenylate cyclase/tetratricopeptide (TPR) repeat protein